MVKHIDNDGDLESSGDRELAPWAFEAAFETDVEIVSAVPDTNGDQPAEWLITHSGDSTRVVVTEVAQDGYRLLAATCIFPEDPDGLEIPTTLKGNSLSFEVFGKEDPDFPTEYGCDFINSPADPSGASATLPPTHTATGTSAAPSELWRIALVGLATLIASLLVLRSREAALRRR